MLFRIKNLIIVNFILILLFCILNGCSSQIKEYIDTIPPNLIKYKNEYSIFREKRRIGYSKEELLKTKIMKDVLWVKRIHSKFTYQYRGDEFRTIELKYQLICDNRFQIKSFKDTQKIVDNRQIINKEDKKFGVIQKDVVIIEHNEKVRKQKYNLPIYSIILAEYLMTSVVNEENSKALYKYYSVSSLDVEEETVYFIEYKEIKYRNKKILVKVFLIENTKQDTEDYYFYDKNSRIVRYTMNNESLIFNLD